MQISSNAGSSWNIPARTLTGDVNFNVTPGTSNHIVWNAGADWNRNYTASGKVRILADDAPTTPPIASMAFVPAGFSNPGKEIYTSAFFMDKTEVSKAEWDADGYRLPTRAEWVKAYWGGNEGSNYFP